MRVRPLIVLAAVMLTAGIGSAALPDNWRDYFDGPPGYLITRKERKQWKRVDTPAQAEQFIDLFWAKRDPNLATPLNEFKEAFDLRVKAADANFSNDRERGAMTDRGKVLILLGRPTRHAERSSEAPSIEEGSGAMGSVQHEAPSLGIDTVRGGGTVEAWVYDPTSLPQGITEDQQVWVVFQETRPGSGDFLLDRGSSRNRVALHLLAQVPDVLVRHPDLEEIPRYGLIEGTEPATAAQLAWFSGGAQGAPSPAAVLTKEGLVSASSHFIWTHIELASGPETALVVGRLRSTATGETVGSFQDEVNALDVPAGRAYELSVPVSPGTWALDVAIARDESPLAVTTVQLETTDVPLDTTVFAPFLWGGRVVQLAHPTINAPFSVGGWHVIPRTDATYEPGDTLNYLTYVLQPDLGDDGQPQIEVRVSLSQAGKRLVENPPEPAKLSQVTSGLWMYGGGVELGVIPRPGDYTLEVQLIQTTDGAETRVAIPFTLVKDDAEPAGASGTSDHQ